MRFLKKNKNIDKINGFEKDNLDFLIKAYILSLNVMKAL